MARLLTLELALASIALLPHVATSLTLVPAPCHAGAGWATNRQQQRRHQQRQLSTSIDMVPPACQLEFQSERKVSSPTIAPRAIINGVAASALCLLSLTRVAAAAEDGESSTGFYPATCISRSAHNSNLPALSSTSSLMSASAVAEPPISVADYLGRVFASPNTNDPNKGSYNAVPASTDPQYDSKDARNRAYDAAFEQDARDRDAYYGKLAMEKRRRAEEDVARYRRELGLDGTGDERVAGMASLREYLLRQDPATLTPEELKVYQRLKQDGEENQYRQQQEGQAAQKEDL